MNPDYYSDIKLAQRFIFQSSIYLLNMFQKKIDSFTTNKTKQKWQRQKMYLLDPRNIIDPDRKQDDPIKELSKDLTKPIWNCITKMQVSALCLHNSKKDHQRIIAMNDQFARFLERFKLEHEDESNFKILLSYKDKNKVFEESSEEPFADKSWAILQELLSFMYKIVVKQEETLNLLQQRNQTNDFLSTYLGQCKKILTLFPQKNELNQYQRNIRQQLYCFGNVVSDQIKSVIQSSQGSTNINYWPNLQFLTELIHPMMIGIYLLIKDQYSQQKQRERQRRPSSIQNIQQQNETVFDELQQKNCSKITFLNLDGYESPFNIHIAKYLSKYVQYISFPIQPNESIKQQQYFYYYQNYSQLLIKQYIHSQLSEQERQFQYKLFKTKQKSQRELMQYYKRLFIFPINSIYLSQKQNFKNIEFYQSKFIKFIMKQLIYIQIKQFNPSVVVLSLSNQLYIDPQFYQQLIKQLTIISNMRLILYNNLTKSYIYDCQLPYQLSFHQNYYRKYENRISMFNGGQINYGVFYKTAVFLKIASGTYTLDRTHQQDNVGQKYDMFRIQKYASNLIKLLGKTHPVLQRFRSRCNEYLRLQRMLSNIYSSQNSNEQLLYNRLPIYKKLLVQYSENKLIEDMQSQNIYGVSREYYELQWKNFILRSGLQKQRQRQQQNYKYITKYIKSPNCEDQNHQQFIAIQFQIEDNGVKHLVNINRNSQVCVSELKQGKKTLIFLFNHLLHYSDRKRHFYGIVDEQIEHKYQTKVKLSEIEIFDNNLQPFPLSRFEYLTNFNYYQIQNHIIAFWPTIYNQSQALLSNFAKKTYIPKISNLIFFTNKVKEENKKFIQVIPENKEYQKVLPRCECTCYKAANNIYIFGGFYNTLENYLKFQVDITVMQLKQSSLLVENVPKEFHFNYQPNNPNYSDLPYRITKLSQDLVRPRIQYQVYQPQRQDMQKVKIMLIGGVGEKFMRPYSIMGYMAHQIVFSKNGLLLKINRIKLNNIVPVNLKKPVFTRSEMQIRGAYGLQNKQIYTKKMLLPANTPTYTIYHNTFVREQQKMSYKKSLQLGIINESKDQRLQNTIIIKQNNSINTAKVALRHYSTLKEIDNKLALICQYSINSVEQYSSIIFNLQLQLLDEVYQQFVNLQSKNIPLLGSNIISIDIYGLEVYAILRHKEYTHNKYILAYCDLSNTIQSFIENRIFTVFLRQIYRFDQRIDHFTLKTLPQKKIAIIHSFPLNKTIAYNEFLLKLTSKGYYIRQHIYNEYDNYNINNYLREDQYKSTPISFYYTNKQTVISWTFKSCRRQRGQEEYYFLIEQLNCRQQFKKWKLKSFKIVNFQKMHTTKQQSMQCNTTILDIKVAKVASQRKYEIYILESNQIYVGTFEVHLPETKTVNFTEYDKSIEEYQIQRFRHRFNVEYLQKLTKYSSRYDENIQEMEVEA